MANHQSTDDVSACQDQMMINEKDRLATFHEWPFKQGPCTKERMAQAGFYLCSSASEPDMVRCFVCLKNLEGWEESDDPFQEHLKLFPNCPFAQYQRCQDELTLEEWITLLKERNTNVHASRFMEKVEKLESGLQKLSQMQ